MTLELCRSLLEILFQRRPRGFGEPQPEASFLHWSRLSSLMGVIINMHIHQVIHRNVNLGNLSFN